MANILSFILFLNPSIDQGFAERISAHILNNCQESYHELVVAIAFKESSFNPKARSETGDIGLMQLNLAAHPEFDGNPYHIEDSIVYACSFLDKLGQNAHNDRMWFGAYHSKTPSLKQRYYNQIWKILNRSNNAK